MAELLSISEAARRLVTWDGKPVSPATVRYWVLKKDLGSQQDPSDLREQHFIDEETLRNFIARYSTYTFRALGTPTLSLAEMRARVQDLIEHLEALKAEHALNIAEEEALSQELFGKNIPAYLGNYDQKAPTRERTHQKNPPKARRAVISTEHRAFWVGRGDVQEYFSFFLYLHEAHGINHNTANSHRRFARKAMVNGTPTLYPCTVIPSGLFGGEDRVVVTEEQALTNINVIHNNARHEHGRSVIPKEFLCLDPKCPCCPILWQHGTTNEEV